MVRRHPSEDKDSSRTGERAKSSECSPDRERRSAEETPKERGFGQQ
jgi:hypothetical protein